jgi:hypothetical protein
MLKFGSRNFDWLLRFLDLSGVGIFGEGGIDDHEARPANMGAFWEAEEEGARRSPVL